MAEIRIERLGAGHRQADRAEHRERDVRMVDEEHHAVDGVDGEEDGRVVGDVDDAGQGEGREPDDHDRPEEGGDPPVPRLCTAKSATRIARVTGTM